MSRTKNDNIQGFGVCKTSITETEKIQLPIIYNKPCETDMCPNNIGLRCSDCKFTGKETKSNPNSWRNFK